MRFLRLLLGCLCLAIGGVALAKDARPDGMYAEIVTPRGTITCELYFQKVPLTVASFVGLAEGTLGPKPRKPYFDGLTFHRVVPGFVIQGGDPTGTGEGGPGYEFPDQFAAGLRHDGAGILSMANSGADTNGSQFFITLGAARHLDYVHSIFGRVTAGGDVPAQVREGDPMTVRIVRVGRAARAFRADDKAFARLLARAPRTAPPHLTDDTAATASVPPPFQARYLETRLTNLARTTGRQIYLRLEDAFTPTVEAETPEAYVKLLPARLHLPPGALLALHFSVTDSWHLVNAPANFKLPEFTPPPAPRTPPTTPDAETRLKVRALYFAAEQMASALIDQTDPK